MGPCGEAGLTRHHTRVPIAEGSGQGRPPLTGDKTAVREDKAALRPRFHHSWRVCRAWAAHLPFPDLRAL